MNEARLLLPLIAGGMVLLTTVLLLEFFPRPEGAPSRRRAAVVCYLLAATSGLWAALLAAVLRPTLALWAVALVGMNLMAAGPLVLLLTLRWPAGDRPVPPTGWRWPVALSSTVTSAELLMGATFVVLVQGHAPFGPSAGAAVSAAVTMTLLSPWFLWAMLVGMVVLLLWVPLPPVERDVFFGLAATGALAPFAIADPLAVALGMGALMGLTLAVILRTILRAGEATAPFVAIAGATLAAFLAMSGTALGAYAEPSSPGRALGFAVTMFVVMLAEMVVLARRALAAGSEPPDARDSVEDPRTASGSVDP